MLARDAMSAPVEACSTDTTVAEAAKRMTDNDQGAMPILFQGRLVGIVTERDVLRSVARRENPGAMKVKYLMTPDPNYLEPDVDIRDAADWMLAAGNRHLPVVHDGQILGIMSMKDVLWALTGGIEREPTWSRNGSEVALR